jgi:hypothetical protein
LKTSKERTEIFKLFQNNIKKAASYDLGKKYLLELREDFAKVYDDLFTVC